MFAALKAALARMEAAVQSWAAGDQSQVPAAQAEVNGHVAAHLELLDARVSKLEGVEPGTATSPDGGIVPAAVA